MTYTKYPTPMGLIHLPSSPAVLGVAPFMLESAAQINSVIIYLAKFGTAGGSETLAAKVYANSDLTAPIGASAAVTVATLPNMDDDWAGWARFSFTTPVLLAANRWYYLGLASADYTANGTTFFVAVQTDRHSPFNKPAWGRADQIAKFRLEEIRQWPE